MREIFDCNCLDNANRRLAASFGLSAFIMADTTQMPAIGMPERTSRLVGFESSDGIYRDGNCLANVSQCIRGCEHCLDLGGGWVDGSNSQIISSMFIRLHGLRNSLGGCAHDAVSPHEFSGYGDWHVCLPHMDTLGIGRQRHIYPVIYDEWHVVAARDGVHLVRKMYVLTGSSFLSLSLHECRTTIEGTLHSI